MWLLAALFVAIVSFANQACLKSGASPLVVHAAGFIAVDALVLMAALSAAREKRHKAHQATACEPATMPGHEHTPTASNPTAGKPSAIEHVDAPADTCELASSLAAAATCVHASKLACEANSAPTHAQNNLIPTPICARQHTCTRYVPLPLPLLAGDHSAAANPTVTASHAAEAQRAQLINRCGELAFEHGLSAREEEVLLMLAQGLSRHDIEDQLVISESTVKSHLRSIYRKVDVHSRTELNSLIIPSDQPRPK